MASELFDIQIKSTLALDLQNRVKLYKAPIYLACSLNDNIHEVVRARTLLNKVATFDMATPTDLNVIIKHTFKLA